MKPDIYRFSRDLFGVHFCAFVTIWVTVDEFRLRSVPQPIASVGPVGFPVHVQWYGVWSFSAQNRFNL